MAQLVRVNRLMGTMEQRLLDPRGLPGRPWCKNMIQAPGALTGHAPKTIPAVHEALDMRDWNRADEFAVATANVFDGCRAQLDPLTAALKWSTKKCARSLALRAHPPSPDTAASPSSSSCPMES